MIDIHTHILPKVDDGASDVEESIRIIKSGIREGIKTFVLTPHIRRNSDWNRVDHIKDTFISLEKECTTKCLDVRLILGGEVLLTPSLPDRLTQNTEIIIDNNHKKYVLLELPFLQLPVYAEDVMYELLMREITPIIAHPERHLYLKNSFDRIEKWVEGGMKLQVNSGSLNGKYGTNVRRFAKKLIKRGLVHFIGSDVHAIDDLKRFGKTIRIASKLSKKNSSNLQYS